MKLDIKKLCSTCKGVIGGKVNNYASGEFPCKCTVSNDPYRSSNFSNLYEWIIKSLTKQNSKDTHWKNGREVYNEG